MVTCEVCIILVQEVAKQANGYTNLSSVSIYGQIYAMLIYFAINASNIDSFI